MKATKSLIGISFTLLMISTALIAQATAQNTPREICQVGTACAYNASGDTIRALKFEGMIGGNHYQCLYSNVSCKNKGSVNNFKMENILPSDPKMNITYIGVDNSVRNDNGLNIDATQITSGQNLFFTATLANRNIIAQSCSVTITCIQQ